MMKYQVEVRAVNNELWNVSFTLADGGHDLLRALGTCLFFDRQ